MTRTLNLLLVVILISLVACQTTPGVTSEDLIGEWRMDGAGYVIQFTEEGSYKVGASEFGFFELEDNLLTFTIADEASFCPGLTGAYEIELTEDGRLHWTLREDECSPRAGVAHNSLWSRTSP